METRHIRLDYEDALSAKKQLLSIELNMLNVLRKIKTYKLLRKKEFAARNKLKINIVSLKTKINLIQSTFPNQEEEKSKQIIKKQPRKKILKEKPRDNIEKELDEIKAKLDKLNH